MLKKHVDSLKTAYGLTDEVGTPLQGEAATAAWEGTGGHFSKLARNGNLIVRGIRNPILRAAIRTRLGRAGTMIPEMAAPIIMTVAVALDLKQVVTSDVPLQTALEKASAWQSAFAGAELLGAFGEGIGGPPGAIVGAIAGSVIGYVFGEEVIRHAVPIRSMAEERAQLEEYMDAHGIPKASEAEYGPMAWIIDEVRVVAEYKRALGSSAPDDDVNQ